METAYYAWFLLFALILYLITIDKNIAQAFLLVSKIAQLWFAKTKWWILYNPRNPIIKYMIWRRSYKLAQQIQKSIEKDANSKG